jgi:hypothetical protein
MQSIKNTPLLAFESGCGHACPSQRGGDQGVQQAFLNPDREIVYPQILL